MSSIAKIALIVGTAIATEYLGEAAFRGFLIGILWSISFDFYEIRRKLS